MKKKVVQCLVASDCLDCGENVWCYSDDELDEMRSQKRDREKQIAEK
jgi:hypothetical protein